MNDIRQNMDRNSLPAENTAMGGGFRLLDAVKFTVPQAAKRMGIGETKMRSIVQRGIIPVLRIGEKTVILEHDIEAYLQGNYGRMVIMRPSSRTRLTALPTEISESPWLKKKNGTEP